jgi:hypothetical protein
MTFAGWFDRSGDEFEFQMLHGGGRPEEQTRLAGKAQVPDLPALRQRLLRLS